MPPPLRSHILERSVAVTDSFAQLHYLTLRLSLSHLPAMQTEWRDSCQRLRETRHTWEVELLDEVFIHYSIGRPQTVRCCRHKSVHVRHRARCGNCSTNARLAACALTRPSARRSFAASESPTSDWLASTALVGAPVARYVPRRLPILTGSLSFPLPSTFRGGAQEHLFVSQSAQLLQSAQSGSLTASALHVRTMLVAGVGGRGRWSNDGLDRGIRCDDG